VIPSSRWDLGFLRPPESKRDAIKPHLDAVIRTCEADTQFRWTIERVRQLQAWLERTKDPAQFERLGVLLRSARIELSAAYGSMHTEFMGSEELNRLVSAGTAVRSQHLASGDLYFEASEVPSVGHRTYFLEQVAVSATDTSLADSSVLESPFFRVQLNPATGAIVSITDLRSHRTIIDETNGGLAGILMRNASPYEEPTSENRVAIHHERGPIVDQVVIERPGTAWPKTVITLPRDHPVVNLTEVLDRSKMRFVDRGKPRDLYSFAFAFSFQGATQRGVDDGEGLYRNPQDLLPGASKGTVVSRHPLFWSENPGKSSYHIVLAQKEAVFDRFQSQTGPPIAGNQSNDGVLADVMVKSNQGDTKNHGLVRFARTSEPGTADAVAAHRLRVQDESAFVDLPPSRRPAHWTKSFLSISAPNVILQALEPSADGDLDDFFLRLQEIAGEPTELRLKFPITIRSIGETTLTEDGILRLGIAANVVLLSPHQTLTLRISVVHQSGAALGENN